MNWLQIILAVLSGGAIFFIAQGSLLVGCALNLPPSRFGSARRFGRGSGACSSCRFGTRWLGQMVCSPA